MKIRRGVCLGFAVFLFLGGCQSDGEVISQPREVRVGVALYDQYDTFIGELVEDLTQYARELEQAKGIKITIMRESADGSQEAQNSQVAGFVQAGCNVICVNLVDRMDASMIIDKADAVGIPVIFFNRELVQEDLERNDALYYVGAEAEESGKMQGRIVADLCRANMTAVDRNGDGVLQYVMLEGEADHQDAVVRTEASVKAVEQAGFRLERLEDEFANWVRSQAESKMSGWLDAHGDAIEVVFANNDDMALGAIDALKSLEIPSSHWPVVVGIDGTSVGLRSVSLGEMSGTVYNDAQGQARGLMDLSLWLAGEGPKPQLLEDKYIRLPYRPVTQENVLDYLAGE